LTLVFVVRLIIFYSKLRINYLDFLNFMSTGEAFGILNVICKTNEFGFTMMIFKIHLN